MTEYDYDVIIVGAGVAGVSTAHHLATQSLKPLRLCVIDAGQSAGEGKPERKSGSATMIYHKLSKIKMMVQIFPCAATEFLKHHGRLGAQRYLSATQEGIQIQKSLAKSLPNGSELLTELGSYYVCPQDQRSELWEEFQRLQSLGCTDLKFVDDLTDVPGQSPDFACGIYFPNDAVIDSSEYAKRLLSQLTLQKNGICSVEAKMNAQVGQIQEHADHVRLVLQNGNALTCRKVVLATGAFGNVHLPNPQVSSLIRPCFSYLAQVSIQDMGVSPNFFTWGFSHDWCGVEGGQVRVSGEDHFSAYKDARLEERCQRLVDWTRARYRQSDHDKIPQQQCGVYSETPDHVPLIGSMPSSNICYMLGCNAWGQAILSYTASLTPGLLNDLTGVSLTEQQQDRLQLFHIHRFVHL